MSTIPSLRWARLATDVVPAWTELTNLLAEYDDTGEFYDAEDLAEELGEHGFDPEQDSWAVWGGDQLVAFGTISVGMAPDNEGRIRCTLGGGVRPSHRGQGIGRELLARMEQRSRELASARHPGVPAYWRLDGGDEGASVRALAARRGYVIVRYFSELARSLPGADIASFEEAGAGVRLVCPDPGQEEATRLAHNDAWRDHWGAGAQTAESWHDVWAARAARAGLSTLALDADGAVLSYVLAGSWVEREVYVPLVGTVRAGRGRGLAAACLARTVRLAAESGEFGTIVLHVDSDSPTGAHRLYERLGFVRTRGYAAMQRDIDPG
ncbi:MAG: GNAT family N-acetyltransferase [Propioniciclava sp.]|uniref:GNAT family N-acetyltransferase n=1 Tax=Propioniciclava sp. TaxID=2038686 RepID=UPI0039E226B8